MSFVELSFDKVEVLINEISAGGKIVNIKDASGKDIPMFICHCSLMEKLNADFEYNKAYTLALDDGFFTAEQTSIEMRKRGFFTAADDRELEKLYSQRDAQEKVLQKTTRVPVRRNRIKDIIDSLSERINKLLIKRERGMEFSAERRAQETKYLYMTWRGTKCPFSKERYWKTKEEFNKETDIDLRTNALVEVIKLHVGMDASLLRYIARNNLWRIRYITSMKTGVSLFGAELPEYTVDQLALAYWSNFYQSVYDMLPSDRPPDSIIEDDAALDAYMKSYVEEQSREAASARMQKRGSGKSAWDHGDVMVMRSNPLYEDMEFSDTSKFLKNNSGTDVKEKNTDTSNTRKNIRARRKKLREHLK